MIDRWYSRPILYADDLVRTLAFYVGQLGFSEDWRFEENGALQIVQVARGGCELIFTAQPRMKAGPGRIFVSLDLQPLETLRADLAARAVTTELTHWGYHTLIVRDPDGNELWFSYPDGHTPA